MPRPLSVARGTEGDCYKCGRSIKTGDFIISKPQSSVGRSNAWVHEGCSPMKTGKHGKGAKRR